MHPWKIVQVDVDGIITQGHLDLQFAIAPWAILLMEQIRRTQLIGSFSHYVQGFYTSQGVFLPDSFDVTGHDPKIFD